MNENGDSNDLLKLQLDVVLKEYEALRNEIIMFSDRQLKLFEFLVGILSLIYGFIAVTNYKGIDIIIVIPFFASPFILRYLWDQNNLRIIGKYMKEEIERKKIPSLIGYRSLANDADYDRLWLGWQHYWDKIGYEPNIKFGIYSKHIAIFILFLLTFLPTLVYIPYKILNAYFNPVFISELYNISYILALLIVFSIIVFLYGFIIWKTIR